MKVNARASHALISYGTALLFVALMTGAVAVVRTAADVDNVSMLYLLAVLGAALLAGSGPAIIAACASFVAFNFFFIDPHYTFRVGDDEQWVALVLLLITGVITGHLAASLRRRAIDAERREEEAVVLFDVARLMAHTPLAGSLQAVAERLCSELGMDAVRILLSDQDGLVESAAVGSEAGLSAARAQSPEQILASGPPPSGDTRGRPGRWIRLVQPARNPVKTRVKGSRVRSIPINLRDSTVGTMVIVLPKGGRDFAPADDRLLAAVASQIGVAIERLRLQREAVEAEVLRRTDSLRAALLNAVSHDLRTPLSSIIASAGSLLQDDVNWTDEERRAFSESIVEEAQRLNRLVGNLLDLSRVESGAIRPEKAWYDLPSMAGEVVDRLRRIAPGRSITLDIPEEMPPVFCDYVEIEQVISNLVENAVRHGQGDIVLTLTHRDGEVLVEVRDSGPGIPDDEFAKIFTPFHRVTDSQNGSLGLGLAIARGFIVAHGGRIWAENSPDGGAVFAFTLPIAGGRPIAV